MLNYKNFYAELKPIATSMTAPRSLVRMGDAPSVIVISDDDESNEGGSIEKTPENPVISSVNVDNTEESTCSNEPSDVSLSDRWKKIVGYRDMGY